jgi:IrrE N-terminal-like domain
MISNNPYLHATRAAEQVVQELSFGAFPIDPFVVARKWQIDVVAKPARIAGVSGMFMRLGEEYGIAYATHIDNLGFQRFSVGHELGHYYLPGHIDAVLGDRHIHESRAGFTSGDRYELEADHFAVGLLMPSAPFSAAMRRAGEGLAAIEYLAGLCQTSLTATAIRLTELSHDPVAIVVSTGEHIDYCFMSDPLREVEGIDWIRKRQVVPNGTLTFAFNRNPDKVGQAARSQGASNLQDWFGGRRSIELSEDVIGLGKYGKTLTILHNIEIPDEEDEDEEESLIESWNPKFHR